MIIVISNLPNGNNTNQKNLKQIIEAFVKTDATVIIAINKEFLQHSVFYEKTMSSKNVTIALDSVILQKQNRDFSLVDMGNALTEFSNYIRKDINTMVETQNITQEDIKVLNHLHIKKIICKQDLNIDHIKSQICDYQGTLLDFIKRIGLNKHTSLHFDMEKELETRNNIGYNDYSRLIDRLKLYKLMNY